MQISKFHAHKNWGRNSGPCVLPYNVVGVLGCFNVSARKNFPCIVVNHQRIPCDRKILVCMRHNTEVFGVFVFAILFPAPVVRPMFCMACVDINIIKRITLTMICTGNPVLSTFGFGIDNHSMYPHKV